MRAELSRQLMINVSNEVGSLAEILDVISAEGINLIALCAYEAEGTAAIMFVADDNNAAKKLLEKQGYQVVQEEVILLSLENKPGALKMVTDHFAEAGVDLRLAYGSVDNDVERSKLVIIAKDNLDAMMVIKTLLERG